MNPFEKKMKAMLKEVFKAGYEYGFEHCSNGNEAEDNFDIDVAFEHWYDQQIENMGE